MHLIVAAMESVGLVLVNVQLPLGVHLKNLFYVLTTSVLDLSSIVPLLLKHNNYKATLQCCALMVYRLIHL